MTKPHKKRGRKPALTRSEAEHALSLYRTSSCSVERVARHFQCSPGVITKIIEGTYQPREDEPNVHSKIP